MEQIETLGIKSIIHISFDNKEFTEGGDLGSLQLGLKNRHCIWVYNFIFDYTDLKTTPGHIHTIAIFFKFE